MGRAIKVGTFDAGATSVTGVGFRPKALWLYTVNATANGFTHGGQSAWAYGSGFAESGGGMGTVGYTFDGGIGDNYMSSYDTEALVFPDNGVVNGFGRMRVSSWDADGFSLTYPTTPSSAFKVGYVAFNSKGLTDSYTFLDEWGNDPESYTGFGFKPDLMQIWDAGVGVNTARLATGSPIVARLQTALIGKTLAGAIAGMSMSRIHSTAVGVLFPASSWGTDPGWAGQWGIVAPSDWNFETTSLDADGFTWDSSVGSIAALSFLGLAMKGAGLAIETGTLTLAADAADVVITPSTITVPRLFAFNSREPGIAIGTAGLGGQTGYGFYDGFNQFVCQVGYSDYAIWDDRYCLSWDPTGIGSSVQMYGVGNISDGSVTLSKTAATTTDMEIQWAAIGLTAGSAPGIYRRR